MSNSLIEWFRLQRFYGFLPPAKATISTVSAPRLEQKLDFFQTGCKIGFQSQEKIRKWQITVMAHRLKAETLADLYKEAAEVHNQRAAFATRLKNKQWKALSFEQLYLLGEDLAAALAELGMGFQDNAGILSDNRLEWIIADYGVQLCGAVDVPRGMDISDQDIEYIYGHCEARIIFAENKKAADRLLAARRNLKHLKHIIILETDPEALTAIPSDEKLIKDLAGKEVLTLSEMLSAGKALRKKGDRRAEDLRRNLQPDDLFTIIYTTGTTGIPKGVMLTHRNIISQIRNIPVNVGNYERILSLLPVWHVYERMFEMMAIGRGCCTYYTNVRNIADDLRAVRPTYMASAPRLWEFLYLRILDRVSKSHWMRRLLFYSALFLARTVKSAQYYLSGNQLRMQPESPVSRIALTLWHSFRWALAIVPYGMLNTAVLEQIRLSVGGSFKGTISGGGALQPHVDEFFNYLGIPVLEGYGLTETSPVLAVRTFDSLVPGTVGPLYPETELRIIDTETGAVLYPDSARPGMGRGLKGEIHVKGPQIMKGYYKDEGLTGRVMKDGWFNTGDIGVFTYNSCLKILGRTKDTVVLLGGENVEPVPLENKLMESVYIEHCMVIGQDQKHLALLVSPEISGIEAAIGRKVQGDLNTDEEVHRLIKAEIHRLISAENGFQPYERITDFRFVPEPFRQGEEITPGLGKLKRHIITEKYKYLIESIYGESHGKRSKRND